MARSIIDGNPDVDEVWEIPVRNHDEMLTAWGSFVERLRERQARHEYDHVFLTQIFPDNFGNYDGTVRASIFRGYPGPITVPVTPVIRLGAEEVAATARFVAEHRLKSYDRVILFECGAGSGQSFVDLAFAEHTAREIVVTIPGTAVVISSNIPFRSDDPRIIDGSSVPFRCNAELAKSCSLLIGCSSGISWLTTSDWAARLPMVQLLKRETSVYASFVHDHGRFGLPTDEIIEMTDCRPHHVADCVACIAEHGFAVARVRFHEQLELDFDFYMGVMTHVLRRSGIGTVMRSFGTTLRRYGPRRRLLAGAARMLWNELGRRRLAMLLRRRT